MMYAPFNPLFIWTYTQTLRQKTNPGTNYKISIRTKNCFPHLTTSVKLMSQNKNSRKKKTPQKTQKSPQLQSTQKLLHFSICNYVCQFISLSNCLQDSQIAGLLKVQLSSPYLQRPPFHKDPRGKRRVVSIHPSPS